MSLAPITLITDKSTALIENTHRKLRQDESGLSITVTVLNEDNTPYNLTGKNLVFCENKQNNKIIIDNGKGDNPGKFNRNSDNDTKGVFTYVLQEDVYAASGKAWFEIDDGTTVDSTKNFYFDVEKDASVSVSNNDYVGSLKALETAMAGAQGKITSDLADMEAQIIKQITNGQSLIKNAESSTQSSIDSLTGKINQAISNGQKDVANSLAETKAANDRKIIQAVKDLTDQTTAALSNVDEYTQKLATLQSQWDSELQSIKNKAGTDTDSAVKAINDRYTNDFNQIKSDFANWQTSTIQNYQKQIEGVTSRGYVELPVEDSERQQLHGHDGKTLSFKKPLIDYDTTLSKQSSAADAYATGQRINDLDNGLTQLNQSVYETFDTKENAQDLKNGILSNANGILANTNANNRQDGQINELITATNGNAQDLKNEILSNANANNRQDEQINGLTTRTNEIESGVINNARTIGILSHDGKSLATHANATITARTEYIKTDSALSKQGSAADAYTVGRRVNDLDTGLTQLNQKIYKTFDTKENAQDLKNGVLANADANRDQDSEISGLQNRASELENNSQTLHLLGHDWSSISSYNRYAFTAIQQFFVNDSTLTNPNGFANAKATGDAINTAYQQLSHSIGLIMAVLDSLDKNKENK